MAPNLKRKSTAASTVASKRRRVDVVTHSEMRQAFKGMLANQTEMKWFEKSASATTAAAGAVDVVTQSIVQGDTDAQRTGDKIRVKSIELRGTITAGTANVGPAPVYVRYMLFRSNFDVASVPAVTDLLQAATITSAYTIRQMQVHRYKVLVDRVFTVAPVLNSVVTGSGGVIGTGVLSGHHFHQKFKLDTEVHYNATDDSSGGNGKGSYFWLVLTNASTTFPTIVVDHMVGFTDL